MQRGRCHRLLQSRIPLINAPRILFYVSSDTSGAKIDGCTRCSARSRVEQMTRRRNYKVPRVARQRPKLLGRAVAPQRVLRGARVAALITVTAADHLFVRDVTYRPRDASTEPPQPTQQTCFEPLGPTVTRRYVGTVVAPAFCDGYSQDICGRRRWHMQSKKVSMVRRYTVIGFICAFECEKNMAQFFQT